MPPTAPPPVDPSTLLRSVGSRLLGACGGAVRSRVGQAIAGALADHKAILSEAIASEEGQQLLAEVEQLDQQHGGAITTGLDALLQALQRNRGKSPPR